MRQLFTKLITAAVIGFVAFIAPATRAAYTIEQNPNNTSTLSGIWYNIDESGWGITFTQQFNIIFATMFTYDNAELPTWYVASNCNVANDGCTGDFFAIAKGTAPVKPWVALDPNDLKRVGAFTATFSDINNATIAYSINGVNGFKRITRQLWSTIAPTTTTVEWIKSPELNAGLPAGIEAYRGSGRGLQAVYATLDPALATSTQWNVASIAPGSKTPLEFAQTEAKKAWVVMNAGYFGASSINQSFSVVVKNSALAATGVKQLTRNGQVYYPTRAAFGTNADGESIVTWTYPIGAANTLTRYSLPAPNDSAKPPQPLPDATFPPGGQTWAPVKAIGGGPMLLKNRSKLITQTEENFDAASGINGTGEAPRSAIAKLANGKILFLVIDGRSALSRGVNLNELADILLSLGATDAINLDGGGSSAMVINGVVANKPSDGVQRSIPSVVVFSDK